MEIKIRQSGHVHILEITGEMDFYSAFRLREVVQKIVAGNIPYLVIDLAEVPCVDSSAVGTLVSVHAELEKRGRSLQITGVRGSVKKALELTRLMASLPIAGSIDEAVERMRTESTESTEATSPPPGGP